jgi:UPF0271 protein
VRIDLNSDLGEGYGSWSLGDDAAILDIVTSANIACGFHAGDPQIMARTTALAAERGVNIGAHVSYPDLRGFGRRDMDVPADEVASDIVYQIGALDAFARAAGSAATYVKAHGALYNRMAHDEELAGAVIDAVASYDRPLTLLVLAGSAAERLAAQRGLPTVSEAFADRGYTHEGALVSRRQPGAVISDPAAVAARAVRLATEHLVDSVDGTTVEVSAGSLCVHGDSPGATALAAAVRSSLREAGVEVVAFAIAAPPVPIARPAAL